MTRVALAGVFGLASVAAAQASAAPAHASRGWQAEPPEPEAPATPADGGEAPDDRPAQSFEQLRFRLRVGDTVSLRDDAGREFRGRVDAASAVALTLRLDGVAREFDAAAVKRIERRRRDPVRNGLLIGAGAGALLGFTVGRAADSPACPRPGIGCGQGAAIGTVGGVVWGALGGWITDALIRKREVVYIAPGSTH